MRLLLNSACGLALGLVTSAAFAQAQPQETSAPALQVTAQPAAQPAATTSAAASNSNAANQVVCHSESQRGSMIPSRVCHTQREWDALRTSGQRSVNDAQMRGLSSQPMGK